MAKRINIGKNDYLSGLQEVTKNIQNAVDKFETKSTHGLADALLFVATESQQRAPVDTGDLRGSVMVHLEDSVIGVGVSEQLVPVTPLPEKARSGTVSFNTKYAATQHEHIEYDHPRGGQAKYLESVLVENTDRILQLIANGMLSGGDD